MDKKWIGNVPRTLIKELADHLDNNPISGTVVLKPEVDEGRKYVTVGSSILDLDFLSFSPPFSVLLRLGSVLEAFISQGGVDALICSARTIHRC